MFSFCSSLPQHQTDLSALHHFFASLVLMPILTQSFPPFPAFHFLLCHFHYQITSSFPGIQTTIFLKSLFQSSSSSEDPWQYILSTIKLQKPAHKKSCKNVLKHLVGTDFQRPLILLSVFELHRQFSTYKTDYWEFTQGQVWRRWMGNNDSPYSQYKNAMEGWALKQEERVFLLWDTWHSETPQCQGKSKRLKERKDMPRRNPLMATKHKRTTSVSAKWGMFGHCFTCPRALSIYCWSLPWKLHLAKRSFATALLAWLLWY